MTNFNAFILAAGRGERLGPITSHLPKPLLPILGKTILELIISKLSLLHCKRYGINTHYKGDIVASHLSKIASGRDITLFPEEDLLGTGGALHHASALLRQGLFLTHNADILSDIDLQRLLDYHTSSGRLVTLAVHDYPLYNNVWIDREGLLLGIGRTPGKNCATPSRCVAFTGIAAYTPGFLEYLPDGYSHITDAWLSASRGGHVGCLDFTGCRWTDIGTPAAYADAVFSQLHRNGETVFIHASAQCGRARLGAGSVLEEGVSISGASQLKHCILMPGTHITSDAALHDKIIGPSYSISLEKVHAAPSGLPESLLNSIPGMKGPYTSEDIGTGGSDRHYCRIYTPDGQSMVLMESPPADPDHHRHIVLSRFLTTLDFPIPRLLACDETTTPDGKAHSAYAVFEDLGDLSLYSWLQCRRPEAVTERIYERILDSAVHLHTHISAHAMECPELVSRSFDYDHLRWETTYFMEQFVSRLKGILFQDTDGLDAEFHRLASEVTSLRRVVVHRDFQSQNIMLLPGDTPRIIDFQGARLGPPAYDVVSLLWDPYAHLGSPLRNRLLSYYQDAMRGRTHVFDPAAFRHSLLPCRLQRHMQALGAYSFLSLSKGKTHFQKYIPSCLAHLREDVEAARKDFPLLHSLVNRLHETS